MAHILEYVGGWIIVGIILTMKASRLWRRRLKDYPDNQPAADPQFWVMITVILCGLALAAFLMRYFKV